MTDHEKDAEIVRLREWLQHISDWGYDWMEGAGGEAFGIYADVHIIAHRAIDGEPFPPEWRDKPNATTQAAIDTLEAGKGNVSESVEGFIERMDDND